MSSVSSGWKVATRKRPCLRSDRLTVELGEDLHVVAGRVDPRRADEDAAQRLVFAGQLEVGLEAGHLAAVRVAGDLDVDEAEMVALEHDQARAGAEDGLLEAADRSSSP